MLVVPRADSYSIGKEWWDSKLLGRPNVSFCGVLHEKLVAERPEFMAQVKDWLEGRIANAKVTFAKKPNSHRGISHASSLP